MPENTTILLYYIFRAAKTAQKINQAFGNDSVNERTVRCWFAKFRSGDFSLEDEPRSDRPTVIQDEELRTLVETDPSQTSSVF